MKRLVAFVVMVAVGVVTANLEEGLCPEFTNIASLDLQAYTGRWYEVERFWDFFEYGSWCNTVDYTAYNDTTIAVLYGGLMSNGTLYTLTGGLTTNEIPGFLTASFTGDTGTIYYNVLDTDYTSFTSVYHCKQVGQFRQQLAYIQLRQPTVDAETLNKAHAAYSQFGINIDQLLSVQHPADCYYVNPTSTPAP